MAMGLQSSLQFFAREGAMFWRKKPQAEPFRLEITRDEQIAKSSVDQLNESTDKLASSLHAYSEAAYRAAQEVPDERLVEAGAKVKAARKLVIEGRIAYALGRCIPEHVKTGRLGSLVMIFVIGYILMRKTLQHIRTMSRMALAT
jgi:hypothetical protein